jgi:hypothetical protein
MSVKPRPRSTAKKPVREISNRLFESPDSVLRPRIISAVRIEQRLFNHLANSKRKLELLKKTLEQEELKEVQSKPKILSKSRILAEKAEQRLLINNHLSSSPSSQNLEKPQPKGTQSSCIQNPKPSDAPRGLSNPITSPAQVQPEISSRSTSRVKNQSTPIKFMLRNKKRTKSLLNLTVLQRNEAWLEERKNKLTRKKLEIEQKDMAECTFSPKTQNKLKQSRSFRDPYSNTSFISSPNSLDISECEVNPKASKVRLYRQIAPYRVNISFKCGIDLNSFLKRAK